MMHTALSFSGSINVILLMLPLIGALMLAVFAELPVRTSKVTAVQLLHFKSSAFIQVAILGPSPILIQLLQLAALLSSLKVYAMRNW